MILTTLAGRDERSASLRFDCPMVLTAPGRGFLISLERTFRTSLQLRGPRAVVATVFCLLPVRSRLRGLQPKDRQMFNPVRRL
jgi:hypothetical protein